MSGRGVPTPPARPLASRFFRASTPEVARRLLGCLLVHDSPEGRTAGRIVETEAYLSQGDEASHSARGETARCASMFLGPGHAYVYLIYGMHHCFNVVTARAGVGEAVLVRALEPVEGLELMQRRRKGRRREELCSGPGRCAQAMGLDRRHDGLDLAAGALRIEPRPRGWSPPTIEVTPRIGIRKAADLPLRFVTRYPGRGPAASG